MCSAFNSLKLRCEIEELSPFVCVMLEKFSRSQYFTVRSVEPFARVRCYGLNSSVVTLWPGKSKLWINRLFRMSQTLIEPSEEPEATHLPSGLYLIELIVSECSRKVATHYYYL